MAEHMRPGDEYADWKAPETSRPIRPGGELQGKPIQGPDGQWYNAFGERIDAPEPADVESAQESVDQQYAARFWVGKPEGLRDSMSENIQRAEHDGFLAIAADPHGISESDRERLSAYRELARELGYEVGQFRHQPQAHNAVASIERVGEAAQGEPEISSETRELATTPESLPPLGPDHVRLVHITDEQWVDTIREQGLDYHNQGMISSTARAWSDASQVEFASTDPRFSGPGKKAIVMDVPMAEYRLHNDVVKSPGLIPAEYIVGVVDVA